MAILQFLISSCRGVLAQQMAAAAGEWYNIAYVETTGGFDHHDSRGAAAMCSVSGGAVYLRGTAQCVMNVNNCMSHPQTTFAVLPPECGPIGASAIMLASGEKSYEVPAGSQVHVSATGRLTLDAPLPGKWMLRLDDTVIPLKSSWGWEVVFWLAIGTGLYLVGGVLHGWMTRGRPVRLHSHPHWPYWHELRSLCTDGAAHARAQVTGRAPRPQTRHQTGLMGAKPHDVNHQTSAHKGKQKNHRKARRESERGQGASESGHVAMTDGSNCTTSVERVDGSRRTTKESAAAGGGRWLHVPS